jgi:amidase
MNNIDLAFADALTQAELIRNRQVSPLELTQLYLERINSLDQYLGSYFYVAADQAIQEATARTEQLAGLDPAALPPLWGVPIAIKDLSPVVGMPCSYGLAALKHQIASEDEGAITKIKQAGLIILGKTATSEMGSFPYTEPLGFPPSRNPWNLAYTSGGSSGGSAAAVAAGLTALAQGSDAGGSIRGPAFCCGVVGLKPSRGLVSWAPTGDRLSGLSSHGPIARTVRDAAALLDAIAGYIPGDPYRLTKPPISFLQAAQTTPPQLHIGYTTRIDPLGVATPELAQAVMQTVHQAAHLGHSVSEISLNLEPLIAPFTRIWATGVAGAPLPKELFSPMNQWIAQQAGSAGEYLQAVAAYQIVARQLAVQLSQYDALITPVYLHPQIQVGEWADLDFATTLSRITNWIAPCPPWNATGQPALSLPTSWDTELPTGVQLVGRLGEDGTVISLAAQLESSDRPRPNLN